MNAKVWSNKNIYLFNKFGRAGEEASGDWGKEWKVVASLIFPLPLGGKARYWLDRSGMTFCNSVFVHGAFLIFGKSIASCLFQRLSPIYSAG